MRYTLRFLLLVSLTLCFTSLTEAQGAGIKKFPGENCTLQWDFPITSETNITGFRIYQGTSATGPFVFTNTTATKSVRTVSLPASFPTGSVMYWYTARAYFTGTATPAQTVESVDSNAVEVDLNVPTPTALTAR